MTFGTYKWFQMLLRILEDAEKVRQDGASHRRSVPLAQMVLTTVSNVLNEYSSPNCSSSPSQRRKKCAETALIFTVLELYLIFALIQDIVNNAAQTQIAIAGGVKQESNIIAVAWEKKQRVVTDARGFIIAKGDISRTGTIVSQDVAGNGMNTDTTGYAVSATGDVTSSVTIKTMSGVPPDGWKCPF